MGLPRSVAGVSSGWGLQVSWKLWLLAWPAGQAQGCPGSVEGCPSPEPLPPSSAPRVCGPHGVPELQQQLGGHPWGRVPPELPHTGRGLCEFLAPAVSCFREGWAGVGSRAQGSGGPGDTYPPRSSAPAHELPWGPLGAPLPEGEWHLPTLVSGPDRYLPGPHSSAHTACPAVSVHWGWCQTGVGAASPRRTAPVCTTRPPTSLERPSGSTATPGGLWVPWRQRAGRAGGREGSGWGGQGASWPGQDGVMTGDRVAGKAMGRPVRPLEGDPGTVVLPGAW